MKVDSFALLNIGGVIKWHRLSPQDLWEN